MCKAPSHIGELYPPRTEPVIQLQPQLFPPIRLASLRGEPQLLPWKALRLVQVPAHWNSAFPLLRQALLSWLAPLLVQYQLWVQAAISYHPLLPVDELRVMQVVVED